MSVMRSRIVRSEALVHTIKRSAKEIVLLFGIRRHSGPGKPREAGMSREGSTDGCEARVRSRRLVIGPQQHQKDCLGVTDSE